MTFILILSKTHFGRFIMIVCGDNLFEVSICVLGMGPKLDL